ncbi:hypothetical protein KRR39_09585 [Nocardioides panacis]|uniref:Uncharacterized protein n=1 Tax=Nocardioides panacis TaxID=2849501 RepID=A0A975T313_9ACTN|nr:hypothetical protein [Nocardioides panacis]QWZ09948.1 hypothetical protein KRR39_09585 [Nocardioides panacis]
MYLSKDARELSVLLAISRELDIVGDVSATVADPAELLAWASVLTDAEVVAWRAKDSGHRYVQVAADRHAAPVRGRVAAVLPCDRHREFWNALGLDEDNATVTHLSRAALSKAWSDTPITPPRTDAPA